MRVGRASLHFPHCCSAALQTSCRISPPALPCSHPQGQLSHAPATKVSSTVPPLPAPARCRAFLSIGRASSLAFMTPGSALPPAAGGKGRVGRNRNLSLLPSCLVWAMSGRASSPTLITLGQSHLQLAKCVERDGGLLSRALKLVKGWGQLSSSHDPTWRPDEGWGQLCIALRH